MILKPLTMTVVCTDCHEQYGAWREHCPSCATPNRERERMMRQGVERERKNREVTRDLTTECALCRRRVKPGHKKSTKCPTCDRPVHKACLTLHDPDCRRFVAERDEILNNEGRTV